MRLSGGVIAVALLCALLPGGPALAADAQLAAVNDPGPVSAYSHVVAWSAPVSDGRWAVTAKVGDAAPSSVTVASSRRPHVSVGPDANGRTLLSYERCRGSRCTPYVLYPAGKPRSVDGVASAARCARVLSPAFAGRTFAFVSPGCAERGIYVRSRGATRRISGGRPRAGLDIGGGYVAAVDTDRALPGHKQQGNIVLVRTRGGARRVLDSGVAGNGYSKSGLVVNSEVATKVLSPSIDGSFVHWLKSSRSPDGADYEVLTARLASGERCASRRLVAADGGAPRSISVADGRLFYTTATGVLENTDSRVGYDDCG